MGILRNFGHFFGDHHPINGCCQSMVISTESPWLWMLWAAQEPLQIALELFASPPGGGAAETNCERRKVKKMVPK
jgi:hypothetical protein